MSCPRLGRSVAGPVSVAMTVVQRRDLPAGYALERLGIGPEDARKARLVAGSAVARIDDRTAIDLSTLAHGSNVRGQLDSIAHRVIDMQRQEQQEFRDSLRVYYP